MHETGALFAEPAQGAGAEAASMGSTIARGERFTIVRTDIAGDRFGELYVFPDATKYGPVPSRLVPTDVLATYEIGIAFAAPNVIRPLLHPGTEFTLSAGRTIAHGTVLRLVGGAEDG